MGGALVTEVNFQQKLVGRSTERPYKRGALVIEVPTYRDFTVTRKRRRPILNSAGIETANAKSNVRIPFAPL